MMPLFLLGISLLFASLFAGGAFPQPTGGRDALVKFSYIVHVDPAHPNARDREGEGSANAPFRSLSRAVDWAVDLWNAEENVKLVIHPGVYSGAIRVVRIRNPSHFLVIEAAEPQTVTISGADDFTNWTAEGPLLFAPWTNHWGEEPLLKSNASPDFQAFSTRQEILFSLKNIYYPVPTKEAIVAGTFFIKEAGRENEAGRIFLQALRSDEPQKIFFSAQRPEEQYDGTRSLLQLSDTANVTVRGIVLEAARGKLPAIHLRRVRNTVIEDCFVRYASRQGVLIEKSDGLSLRRIAVDGAGWGGFALVDSKNVLAEELAVRGSQWRKADEKLGAFPFRVQGGSNIVFRRLLVESNAGPALYLEGSPKALGFEGAVFVANARPGEVSSGAKVQFLNSSFYGNGAGVKYPDGLDNLGLTNVAPEQSGDTLLQKAAEVLHHLWSFDRK